MTKRLDWQDMFAAGCECRSCRHLIERQPGNRHPSCKKRGGKTSYNDGCTRWTPNDSAMAKSIAAKLAPLRAALRRASAAKVEAQDHG